MYTVKFQYFIDETVIDLITNQKVQILGTFYLNGYDPYEQINRFHEIVYWTTNGPRTEEDLQKI